MYQHKKTLGNKATAQILRGQEIKLFDNGSQYMIREWIDIMGYWDDMPMLCLSNNVFKILSYSLGIPFFEKNNGKGEEFFFGAILYRVLLLLLSL